MKRFHELTNITYGQVLLMELENNMERLIEEARTVQPDYEDIDREPTIITYFPS